MLRELDPTTLRKFIDKGADSNVFRIGDIAIKEYNQKISFEQLISYNGVNNRAVDILNKIPHAPHKILMDQLYDVRFTVNPITLVFWDRDKSVGKSVSNYIRGPRLEDLLMLGAPISISDKLEGVRDPYEKQFFDTLARSTNVDGLGFSPITEISRLSRFSQDLNKKLGVSGIDVVPQNVKVRFDPEENEINYIVTDLCSGLLMLKTRRGF